MKKYDALILGSGQGGNPLAHKLADRGWKVALVEEAFLGGSCINYGCTPTKTLIASARVAHVVRRASEYGLETGPVRVDFERVMARMQGIVRQWREGQQHQVEQRPTLDLYRAHGRFTGPNQVDADGEGLEAEQIFIDTGTRPRIPDLDGLDRVPFLTNLNIFDLQQLPEHLLILGGNYLGLEFGQMFRRFGSQVTVVEQNDRIASGEDEDVSAALQEILEGEGLRFLLNGEARQVRPADGGIALVVRQEDGKEETLSASHLLVAVGRAPNTDRLGLGAAGVATDEHGFVQVDACLQTDVPGVWALGDVTGGPAFTHISYDDHLIIWDHLFGEGQRRTDRRLVPYALYTDPELGRVGLTEREAREQGRRLRVGKISMEQVARAVERGEPAGLMKVVVDAGSDRILGAAVLGPDGGELVQTLMALMMADAPWTLFQDAIFIHPTLTEGFFALMKSVAEDG